MTTQKPLRIVEFDDEKIPVYAPSLALFMEFAEAGENAPPGQVRMVQSIAECCRVDEDTAVDLYLRSGAHAGELARLCSRACMGAPLDGPIEDAGEAEDVETREGEESPRGDNSDLPTE